MARPKSKEELEALSQENFDKLLTFVESFSSEQQNSSFLEGTMNRNIRDVLAHLYQWHLLMLNWYAVGMKGEKPDMPAKDYTWKTSKELNRKIWEECQSIPLEKAKESLLKSHQKVCTIIKKHTNDELFTKKKYKWTGSTSLGAYLISSTSSHYDWAFKLIKKQLK